MPIAFVGSEFLVNSTTASDQIDPHICVLSDGRIVVTYDSYDSPGDGTLVPCVRVRILDPLNPGTAPNDFIAETTTPGQQFDNEVTALHDGRFFVTWRSNDTEQLRGRIFDAGDPGSADDDFLISTTASTFELEPSATMLTDGRFIVAWRSHDTVESSPPCIRARIFNADGTSAADDFIVNTTEESQQLTPSLTPLPGGGFVAVWASDDTDGSSPLKIRARVFDSDGNGSDDFLVNTTETNLYVSPSVSALADGRFMVVWQSTDTGDGDEDCIRGRIFNADGTPVGDDFIVNSTAEGDQEEVSVTALADGRFVVMWDSHDSAEGVGNADCARARIVNADGTLNGDDFIINTTPGGSQETPRATALADGRFVAVWGSGDGQEVASTFAVRAQVFDPKIFTGTADADVWKGGNLVDQISGDLGADVLSGLAGNDMVDGAAGADTLTGGLGKDLLTGGTEADIFDFNFRGETLKGAGRDLITDFAHLTDDIDLSGIDARSGAGNQAFKWIGKKGFHDVKGELHYKLVNLAGTANDKTIVEGDVNGDGRADFQIELSGLIGLTKGDFVL